MVAIANKAVPAAGPPQSGIGRRKIRFIGRSNKPCARIDKTPAMTICILLERVEFAVGIIAVPKIIVICKTIYLTICYLQR